MAEKIQMSVNYRRNNDAKSAMYTHWYAEVNSAETLTNDGLVDHIRHHNCAVGVEAIKAVIAKLGECIPELVAQGQPVRIDGLGTFYATIVNKKGGATEVQMKDKEFVPSSIIEGVHLRFRPEGTDVNNLTSKSYLEGKVSPASEFCITEVEKRTVNGKERTFAKFVTLEDFRNPADNPNP